MSTELLRKETEGTESLIADLRLLASAVDTAVVRCQWCIERIGYSQFFRDGLAVTEPARHGLLSDTICAECLAVLAANLALAMKEAA